MRMKPYLTAALGFGLVAVLWADPTPLQSVILSSSPTEPLRDSKGAFLDSTFIFALGVFVDDLGVEFVPTDGNTDVWFNNFVPFLTADFADQTPDPDQKVPRFGGEANFMSDGSSSGNPGTTGAFDFSGMNAWLWVYNGTDIQSMDTEWFLGRADSWVFPKIADFDPDHDCFDCPGSFPVQWALSDIFQTSPVWGRRQETVGGGFASNPDELAKLQTYALIPEPQTWITVLALLSAFILFPNLRRRNRA